MTNSLRLKTIADLVSTKNVFDIGCDHGYLSIYLSKNHKVVASDISISSINKTIKNMEKSNVSFKCIQADGLNGLDINKNDTIIISGMGTKTIIDILNNHTLPNTLIIQSNNNLYELRQFITNLGYLIDDEKAIYENSRYYVIIKFVKGKIRYSKIKLLLGVHITNKDYYKNLYKIYNKMYKDIPKKHIFKRIKIYYILKKISSLD